MIFLFVKAYYVANRTVGLRIHKFHMVRNV
jgi:hypothetical protein